MRRNVLISMGIVILLIFIFLSYVMIMRSAVSCTSDCQRVCDPELKCCYDDCISGNCPGKAGISYWIDNGYINMRDTIENGTLTWAMCNKNLPE